MSARKITITFSILAYCLSSSHPLLAVEANSQSSLAKNTIANQLGWVVDPTNACSGYYLDPPFTYVDERHNPDTVSVTSASGMLSQHSTSILEGSVTINRYGQQITANKAYLYRDPVTGKLSAIDMIGDVNLREPNSLVVGKIGRYQFDTQSKTLSHILYRTTINPGRQHTKIHPPKENTEVARKITKLTAWGRAYEFSQTEANVYELTRASYTTCSPIHPAWRVKASKIVLNKNTGRGYATNARVLVKNIPILYLPYLDFSIDKQRKSGFLWPTVGGSNKWGPYLSAPFYWNMAPNYDMTITPSLLTKRGVQLADYFRYLTQTHHGSFKISVLPNDKAFEAFKDSASMNEKYTNPQDTDIQPASVTEAELNRLLSSSNTRFGLVWRDDAIYNEHWSSHLDYNLAGDDYYLSDFGRTLNEISANQLVQEGDISYKGQNWNFIGRLQAYQTLHPIDQAPVLNQYRRFPQLLLNGDYPDQAYGLEYFVSNEITNFDIRKTPGTAVNLPIGTRLNFQPGISLPLYWSSAYLNPRLQFAFTSYNLHHTTDTDTPHTINRALPIFDIASGATLERQVNLFGHRFQQTLEPQAYYTYIPYRNQDDIPVFDTTVNTLTYDQLFNYNRFTGIDRIGDANQIGLGMTTRLIDDETGLEKARLGVGQIVYFANRRVTLCQSDTGFMTSSCHDDATIDANKQSLSPVSGLLNYHVNRAWSMNTSAIWNPITKQLDNSTIGFQYRPDDKRVINLGYTYARSGDAYSGLTPAEAVNNLKVTDVSTAWPVLENVSVVGRWSQNWNQDHLQNLLYGIQYDTCCWAIRLVGGRAFVGLDPNNNNQLKYNNEAYLQFSLKGLGDIGTGNPSGLLSGIPGYQSQFGQEI